MTDQESQAQTTEQDYTEEPVENGALRWMSLVVVVIAVVGFFGLAWYAYQSGTQTTDIEEVPMVEADGDPIKQQPDDPGGIEIPNQDKTVYDTISNGAGADRQAAERVVPAPEEPVQMDNTAPQTWVNDKLYPTPSDTPVKVVEAEEPATVPTVQVTPAPTASVVKSSPTTMLEPVSKTEVTKEPAVQKPVVQKVEKKTAPAASTGGVKIQLGAYKSEAEASKEWKRISGKFAGDLSGKDHRIYKADVPGKGTFYRLQLSGFSSAADAKSTCAALSAQGQGCFIAGGK